MLHKKLFVFLFLISSVVEAKPCKDLVQGLLTLYPDQDTKMMVLRLQNASDKHKFLRSFIPYYYDRAHAVKEQLPVYSKLKNHRGQIAGDAHVENFGFMVDNNGKSFISLNDYDDVAEGPLFLDVMRLSQSSSYVSDVKQEKLIKAYQAGLMDKERQLSKYLRDLKKKSKKGGDIHKADIKVTPEGPRFAAKSQPASEVTPSQLSDMEKVLKSKYGQNTKLHDSYVTMKQSGGSAFGKRYHTLVEMDGEMHFVEFKEIMDSGVVGAWSKSKISNEERVLKGRDTFLGSNMDQKLDVVKVDGKSFQLRFKAEGNKSIDLTKVKAADLEEVIQDEFYILGQLHRKSLGESQTKISEYASDLNKVSTEDWEQSVKMMRKEIKQAYSQK